MNDNVKKININDYCRVVLSETAPFDIPIIFTNTWFYNHLSMLDSGINIKNAIVKRILTSKKFHNYSIPMKYRIRKNDSEFRHIGVIHPAEQFKLMCFYKEFTKSILHYTNRSPFSIRFPKKVASSFYIKNKFENAKKYKNDEASGTSDEEKFRHSTTYFSYGGYTRLHDFFDSSDYRYLETKFNYLWSVDVSKCFDSIYTHSISWAVKSKSNAKINNSGYDSFSNAFDKLMQCVNYNETNGIVIGNEVSRIFCEIIFQRIDLDLISSLKDKGVLKSRDYEVRRYIDDFFIFSKSERVSTIVLEELQYHLHKYKLHLNHGKTRKQGRPFLTDMSRSKIELSKIINEFSKLIFSEFGDTFKVNSVTRIKDKHKLINNFVAKIKSACGDVKSYEISSGYIIGFLLRSITQLSESNQTVDDYDKYKVREALIIVINIAFHFFGISPNTSNSFKLSMMCFIMVSYADQVIKDEVKSIKLEICLSIKSFFESGSYVSLVENDNYFPIELANMLAVARNMGDSYFLPPKEVKKIFYIDQLEKSAGEYLDKEICSDYFRIVCALYYIGDHEVYNEIKSSLVISISKRIQKISDTDLNSKFIYLLLDVISCPYIKMSDRESWCRTLYSKYRDYDYDEIISESDFFEVISKNFWFISWSYPDLWNTLEKRQLILSY